MTAVPPGSSEPAPGRPLVFAHRGASGVLPEHTLAAYRRALDDGADGLECDVRLTRDGHLVCLHDGRLERVSDGRGRVSRHRLAELERLDFGSWHTPDLPPEGTGVLPLEHLLELVRDAGRPVRLLIETKHPSRYGGRLERRLVALLHRYGLARPRPDDPVRVSVMSFSPLAVRRIHRLAPTLPTVQLLELVPPGMRTGRVRFGTPAVGPGIALVRSRPHLVPALRAAGQEVYVWTVNRPADVALVARLGVAGIITDHPAETQALLRGPDGADFSAWSRSRTTPPSSPECRPSPPG